MEMKTDLESPRKKLENSLNNFDMKYIAEPIIEILVQLKDKINNGEYSWIVGDDASGRVPALIFLNVMKKIYKEKGFEEPKLYFIAGGRESFQDQKLEKVSKYIEPFFEEHTHQEYDYETGIKKTIKDVLSFFSKKNKNTERGGRVLFVTEIIARGEGLEPITKAFIKNNLAYDIATLFGATEKEKMEEKLGSKIFKSEESEDLHYLVYGKSRLSGVIKNPNDVLGTPFVNTMKDAETAQETKDEIRETREDIKIVSEIIYNKFQEEK